MSNTFAIEKRKLGCEGLEIIEDIKHLATAIEKRLSAVKSRESSLAITNLEQVVMWATKSVFITMGEAE